jgi:hypothetical protein
MGKRFVETNRWRDAFFRELSPDAKLAYSYMTDACDNAGVFDPDWRLASFSIGKDMDWDSILDELGNRIERLVNGKIYLTRFIRFQYGELNPTCAPHRNVLELLKRHGIELKDVYRDRSMEKPQADKQGALELHGTNGSKPAKARDLIFEALAEAEGIDISRLTPAARGRLNKSRSEILEVDPDATPDLVRMAARNWKKKGYTAPATARTIANHWAELTPNKRHEADKAQLRQQLKEKRAKLSMFMDDSRDVPFLREDLSEEEMHEAQSLFTSLADLEKQLSAR